MELPSDGLADRITNAVDAAFKPTPEEGRRGQPKRVHEAMTALFGDRTPSYMTVTRWLDAEEKKRLTIDAAFMIARALNADPAALVFGPMATPSATQPEESETTALDIRTAKNLPPARRTRPAKPSGGKLAKHDKRGG